MKGGGELGGRKMSFVSFVKWIKLALSRKGGELMINSNFISLILALLR